MLIMPDWMKAASDRRQAELPGILRENPGYFGGLLADRQRFNAQPVGEAQKLTEPPAQGDGPGFAWPRPGRPANPFGGGWPPWGGYTAIPQMDIDGTMTLHGPGGMQLAGVPRLYPGQKLPGMLGENQGANYGIPLF